MNRCDEREGHGVLFMDLVQKLLLKLDDLTGESQLECNNQLLQDYTIYLAGDFDDNMTKQQGQQPEGIERGLNAITKGRICLLLKFCGAKVLDRTNIDDWLALTTSQKAVKSKTLILASDSNEFKNHHNALGNNHKEFISKHPVISCHWLFNSIAEFKVKRIESYELHVLF